MYYRSRPIPASAQDDGSNRENGRKLEGAWNVVVTSRNCATGAALRTFPGLVTYVRGGTMFEYSVGSATATGQAPTERSTAQGTWRCEENGVYTGTVWFFRFGTDNLYAGPSRSAFEILLGDDGESFTSTETLQVFDTAGALTATRCNTRTGTRLKQVQLGCRLSGDTAYPRDPDGVVRHWTGEVRLDEASISGSSSLPALHGGLLADRRSDRLLG